MHQPMQDNSLTLTNSVLDTPVVRVLHPNLRRALGVLDARLEDELARYRRHRAGLRVAPSAVAALQRSSQTSPLQLPIATPSVAPVAPDSADADEDITVDQTPIANVAKPGAVADNAENLPPLPPRTPLSFQNDLPEDASSALVIAAVQDDADVSGSTADDELIQADDLAPSGFFADANFAADGAPNDYLESSEELLRSLAAEEANVAAEKSVLEGLLTPFGVGSMLLMLLGSGMFGYLIMNPASLTAVKDLATKIASFRTNIGSAPTTVATIDVDGGGGAADTTWQSNAPALDSNEFLNLSLGNISALRTRPGGSLLLNPQSGNQGQSPLQQLDGQTQAPGSDAEKAEPQAARKSNVVITGLKPIDVKPITPPAPTIAKPAASRTSGGLFSGAPVKISPAPKPVARPRKPVNDAPSRPARRYEPPAPSYQPPAPPRPKPAPVYNPPAPLEQLPPPPTPVPAPVAKPAPAPIAPPAPIAKPAPSPLPEPKGDYRVVTPYTNDAALESAQQKSPNASFRNLDDGAYIQYGNSFGSKAAAEAKAAKLREQGVNVEIK